MFEKNSIRIPTTSSNENGVITDYLYQDFIIHDTAYDRISDNWKSNNLSTWVNEDSKHIIYENITTDDMFLNVGFQITQFTWFHSFKYTYYCNELPITNIITFANFNRQSTGDWECWFHKNNSLDYTQQIIKLDQSNFYKFKKIPNEANSIYKNGIKHIYQIPNEGNFSTKGMFVCSGVSNNKERLFLMEGDFCNNNFSTINDDAGNILEILPLGDPGEADSQGISWATITNIENKYLRMWYEGYDGSNYRILTAVSYDGLKWYKEGVKIDLGTNFDSVGTSRPFIVKENDLYKLYYTGFDGNLYRIMSAISYDGGVRFHKNNQIEYYDLNSQFFKSGIRTFSIDNNKRYIQLSDENNSLRPIFFFETITQGLNSTQVKCPANRNVQLRSNIPSYPDKTGILVNTNFLSIYDLTQTKPKMWMKFPINPLKAIKDSQNYFCKLINGILFILRINPQEPSITIVDFVQDIIYDINNEQSKIFSKNIMNREQDGEWNNWDRELLTGKFIHNISANSIGSTNYLCVCSEEGFDLINIDDNSKKTFLVKGISDWEPIWCDINKKGDCYVVIKDFNNQDTQLVAYYEIQNKNSETIFQDEADAIYTMNWASAPAGVYTFINGIYGINEIERIKIGKNSTEDVNSNKLIVTTDNKGITIIDEFQGNESLGVSNIYDTIPTELNHKLIGNSDNFISAQVYNNNLYAISDAITNSDWLNKFNIDISQVIESYGENIDNNENVHYKFEFANNKE